MIYFFNKSSGEEEIEFRTGLSQESKKIHTLSLQNEEENHGE
jgi:hypothetical protein